MNNDTTATPNQRVLLRDRSATAPRALVLVRLLGDRIESGPQHAEFSSSI